MAKKVYSKKSHMENIGPLSPNASGGPDDRGNTGLPREAVALLETISGTESAGAYNVIYRGDTFKNYDDHPRVWVKIPKGPNKGKFSAAAGKYQFIPSTWDGAAKALGLTDFSPASQDKAAWHVAQAEYAGRTGRDLLTDLQAGGEENMTRIGRVLANQWTSLPGGIEQGQGAETFTNSYNAHLGNVAGHPVPPVGVPNPLPAPAPLTAPSATSGAGRAVAAGIGAPEPAVAPTPHPRPAGAPATGTGLTSRKVRVIQINPDGTPVLPAAPPVQAVPQLQQTFDETMAEQRVARGIAPAPTRASGVQKVRTETGGIATAQAGSQQMGNSRPAVADTLLERATGAARAASTPQVDEAKAETRARQKQGAPVVKATGLSAQQIGQEAERARLNGYREIQEAGPSLPPGGGSVKSSTPAPTAAAKSPAAIPKYITTVETVKAASPSVDEARAETLMRRNQGAPAAAPAPTTITRSIINPEWLAAQAGAAAPAVEPEPEVIAQPVQSVGLGYNVVPTEAPQVARGIMREPRTPQELAVASPLGSQRQLRDNQIKTYTARQDSLAKTGSIRLKDGSTAAPGAQRKSTASGKILTLQRDGSWV